MKSFATIQTLNQYKRLGETESYSLPKCEYLNRLENVISLDHLCYDKYDTLLIGMSILYQLSVEDAIKYKYRPELLSHNLYGTPMLSHLLIYINRCSEFTFDMNPVRIIQPELIDNVFNYILSDEGVYMKINNSKVTG